MQISVKCSVAIHCLVFIHEYSSVTKVTSDLLASSTHTNAVTIRNILSALKKDGIVSVKSGTGGAEIILPLEDITIYRICTCVEPDFVQKMIGVHTAPSENCPVGKRIHQVLEVSYEKIREDLCESMRKITLKDVLADYNSLSEK